MDREATVGRNPFSSNRLSGTQGDFGQRIKVAVWLPR